MKAKRLARGCVHLYTGEGKGKTTAALGLALRATGAGLNVFIGQFAKRGRTSEVKALARLSPPVTVRQFGRAGFIRGTPAEADIRAARRGLAESETALASGAYDVVILDEVVVATQLGLFPLADLLRLIAGRPPCVELVLTGRGATRALAARADLVTEMREVKHYYRQGIGARRGIEC